MRKGYASSIEWRVKRTVSDQEFIRDMQLILDNAKANNVILRLIGSIATRIHSESARAQVIPRALTDIDFVGYSSQSQDIIGLFQKLGYSANEEFNTFHGKERLQFFGKDGIHIDVFLDTLSMCHKLDLRGRLELDYPTIPLTDLLMTKLQIVELNEKDVKDMICLLHDHEISDKDLPEKINGKYLADVCSRDWGMYKTFTMNLGRVLAYVDKLGQDDVMHDHVTKQCKTLRDHIDQTPKTTKWKLRARVGEKKRWYGLPED